MRGTSRDSQAAESAVPWRTWPPTTTSASSSPLAAPRSRRNRPACPSTAPTGASPDCVARRSPSSPASASSTTPASSAAASAASPTASWTASCTPCSSTRPNATTSTGSCAPRPPPPADARRAAPRPRSVCVPAIQRILDQMPMPAYLRNGRFDVLAANELGRALYSPLYDQADAGEHPNSARFLFLDPAAPEFFLDYDKVAQRLRRVPARRSRTRPLRQGALRPHRRALHPQRGLPAPLGGPRRPLPPHRPQAVPPPPGRRPRARLRSLRAPRRPRPAHQRLHRPARHPRRGGAEPPGQLEPA